MKKHGLSRFLWLASLLFLGKTTLAQTAWRPLSIPTLGSVGFTNESIAAAAEDGRGFLWFGYTSGLYKYDGNRLVSYQNSPLDPRSITFGQIQHLLLSRDGRFLWVGSRSGGLSRLELKTETADSFLRNAADSTSLAGNEIGGFLEDENGLWVGSNLLTLHFLPRGSRRFQRFQAPIPTDGGSRAEAWALGKIVADPTDSNILWVGSRFGLYRFEKKAGLFRLFPFEKPILFNYDPSPLQIWPQPDGRAVWTSSLTQGLWRFDAKTGERRQFIRQPSPVPRGNEVRDFWPVSDSLTVVLMINEAPWCIHWHSKQVVFDDNFGGNRALFSAKSLLFHDHRGEVWMSNPSRLFRVSARAPLFSFEDFDRQNPALHFLNNWQRAALVAPDDERVFLGTLNGDGLLIWNRSTDSFRAVRWRSDPSQNRPDVRMDALCLTPFFESPPSGRLWIASEGGLLFWEENRQRLTAFRPDTFEKVRVKSLAEGSFQGKKCLWVGTKGAGLFRIGLADGLVERVIPSRAGEPNFIGDEVQCLLTDHEKKSWLAAADRVFRFNPTDGTTQAVAFFNGKKWTDAPISDLQTDAAGNLWISTLGSGLFCVEKSVQNGRDDLPTRHFNNDLPGANVIYRIAPTRDGDLWTGNDAGISRLHPTSGVFINYNDHIPAYGTLLELPDGSMMRGANRGFSRFWPENLTKTAAPQPYLRGFEVFGKKMNPSAAGGPIQLDYRQNHFSFELGAIDFEENARPLFSYKLDGHDSDWQPAGERDLVAYTNLPDGRYRFWLRAANQHGIWSEAVALLDVEIRPPFWKTWWFLLLAGGLLAAIFWKIWQTRTQQAAARDVLRRKEQLVLELDKKVAENQLVALRAQMNPHFLFNCLNSVNWFLLKNRPDDASQYLTKFSRLVRLILDHSRSSRISLADEIGALRLYLEMEAMRFENRFDWKISVADGLDESEISLAPMLLQPFVENSIWHGLMPADRTGRLEIRFLPAENGIFVEIEDNGVGRTAAAERMETAATHRSHGLKITLERLELLHGLNDDTPVAQFFDLKNEVEEPRGTLVRLFLGEAKN